MLDFVDEKLSESNCDDSLKFTKEFLIENNLTDFDKIISWLNEKGGYCDCEILNNVEEYFEDNIIL